VIVAAKALGTALVGRLFILTEPQLIRFPWFARALDRWRRTKHEVTTRVRASWAWQSVRRMRRRLGLWLRRLVRRAS
jgi:hypothetical protein